MDQVVGLTIFTKINIKDIYYYICIKEENKQKTTFHIKYKYYKFLMLPIGLTNAPAIFQSYINNALGDLVNSIYVVYLNNILIYSRDKESYQ